jgi:hypothetical protein
MGGILARPAERWPNTFGRWKLFHDHPYLLPCAAASGVAFLAFIVALFGLREVCFPTKQKRVPQVNAAEMHIRLYRR